MTEDETKVARVAEALKQSFRKTVAQTAGVAFDDTGVAMPSDDTWERYARDAIASLSPTKD